MDCVAFAAWCASHGYNNYATGAYFLGLTQTGDPALEPEESESMTAGIIWNADATFSHQWNDQLRVFVDIMNMSWR